MLKSEDVACRLLMDLFSRLKRGIFDTSLDYTTVQAIIKSLNNTALDNTLSVISQKPKSPSLEDMRSIHNKLSSASFMSDLNLMVRDGELTSDQLGFINLCLIESYFMGKHSA